MVRGLPAVAAAGLSVLALGVQPAAAQTVRSAFDPPTVLPDGAGAVDPSLLVSPDGPVGVLASTSPGEGCALYTVSHTGGLAQYLGRLPGGTGCALAGSAVGGTPVLAYSGAARGGAVDGGSADGGLSFDVVTAPVSTTGAVAADPAPDASGTIDLYALTIAADGLPHLAWSHDGGRTFAVGSSIVDPAQVPAALWSGPGPALATGNMVARRTDTGLTLYTAFETSASAADRAAQAARHGDDLGRVYEAVGVVAPGAAGAAPAVTWTDSLVAEAPPGGALDRALPSTAVDSAGNVYTTFSDGHHVFVATSAGGITWPSAPVAVDSVAVGTPAGLIGAVLPAIAAGGSGAADLAWYGATGGDPTAADPLRDPANTWNVVMAQTLDGGKSWRMTPVTNTGAHQGVLCVAADVACAATPAVVTFPDSALQIAVDQVTGAAVLAFAGDAQSPGVLSLLETRQCTGQNALTGAPVVDDCVAMQPATPVLPGTSCPGPQITDSAGDAIATAAGMRGANLPSLDLLTVRLTPSSPTVDAATITVNRMTGLPSGVAAATWRVMWSLGGERWYAEATSTGGGFRFTAGRLGPGGEPITATPVTGAVAPGAGGGITLDLPRSAVGGPSTGTLATDLEAATYAIYTASGPGVGEQLVDRAPDGGYGAPYAVGSVCPPSDNVPEAPVATLVPVAGGVAAIVMTALRRRRSRRATRTLQECS